MVFKVIFVIGFEEGKRMASSNKFTFTKPRQIPLFEEQDDGSLRQYSEEE